LNVGAPLRVLILGGTTEASALARAVAGDARFAATLSLAGRTRTPVLPPIPHRIGGFGGIDGLATLLREQAIDALVDATHPFAAQMTRHAVAAAAETGILLLRIARPAWQPEPGDRWLAAGNMAEAARLLGESPRRVFVTVGQQDLAPFAAAPWHRYLIRSVDPPAAASLPPDAEVITARGPFVEADEIRLLRQHRIDILVSKNSGGAATAAKLAAARGLGIPVVMVARPVSPACETVADADAAFAWLARHAGAPRGV
jgi:precorrin-6A/cobalt-precorrin-6A reductase